MKISFIPKKILIGAGLLCFGAVALFSQTQKDAVRQNIVVEPVAGLSDDFMMGADISSLAEVEKHGGKFYNAQGKEDDLINILKENGVNWVRLRVWNNPTYAQDLKDASGKVIAKKGQAYGGGNNSVKNDIPMAVRAKNAGMKLLIDFHYSDSWADPAKQNMPQDWAGLNQAELNEAIEKFTRESLNEFAKAGAVADAVQIGNELNGGFMWPMGKTWGEKGEKIGGMKAFTTLLASAARGVRASEGGDKAEIVIHLADGADKGLYKYMFDEITKAKIDYDIIGLSYYSYWHGTQSVAEKENSKEIGVGLLKENMDAVAKRYGKKLAVVETSYGWTTEGGDDQGDNFQIFSEANDGYTASVQGQATAVRDVIDVVAKVPGGCGVFYWEPAWLPVKGAGLSATEGATWENQAMFDFTGKVLPSMAVWNLVRGKGEVKNVWGGSAANSRSFSAVSMEKVSVITKPLTAPVLPQKIKVVLSNGREKLVDVSWENHDWSLEKESRTITLKGKINGESFVPSIEVIVDSKVNLISDPSFESGKWGAWKYNGNGAYCYMENNKGNAHSGKWTYKYWSAGGFQSLLSQDFTGLENGTYVLSIYAMGGGGETNIRLFAANYGDGKNQTTCKIENTGWNIWKKYSIEIPVQNGKATVGIYLDTMPDCWGNFDDIEFYKK